jgi:hypothetical protein
MAATRIEIFKDNLWVTLLLGDSQQVKYNAVINRIASMNQREISHTNTFSLPYIYQNIQALGINVFNQTQLAMSLNNKHLARYYVGDELLQQGFLVINNTNGGTINVNFIDEALQIIEKWGATSYYDLLNSSTISIPEDYKTSIALMKTYSMNKTAILVPLTTVGTRGYNIAKFPNNLNAIGDKFQIPETGTRLPDEFNPYQSRPIFNVKALFDLAIESFEYTPYYDNSIDWARLAETYIVESDLSQSQKNDSQSVTSINPTVSMNTASLYRGYNGSSIGNYRINFVYPNSVTAFYPSDFSPLSLVTTHWNEIFGHPFVETDNNGYPLKDYMFQDRCILQINPDNQNVGTLNWKADINYLQTNPNIHKVWSIWKPISVGSPYILSPMVIIDEGSSSKVDITVNKTQLETIPTGAESLVGIYCGVSENHKLYGSDVSSQITNLVFTEITLPLDVVSYDKYDQYEADIINLTHAAPRKTIKELLSSIMQREGILMSFDNKAKTVKLFSYGSYVHRKDEGNFSDWTKYHQRYDPPLFNTNFGNEYAKVNEIGLESAYKGNTYKLILANQGLNSKYKDYTENFAKFKDVEAIKYIQNSITPYFEYTNKGLGLIEVSNTTLGGLKQVRANGVSQGNIPALTAVYNVNGLVLPSGTLEWYNIIDTATKAEATFLLPVRVVKELDMAEPIYVEGLGGFYIIEEIPEYTDAYTPVKVKLIKLKIESGTEPIVVLPDYSDDFSSDYSH